MPTKLTRITLSLTPAQVECLTREGESLKTAIYQRLGFEMPVRGGFRPGAGSKPMQTKITRTRVDQWLAKNRPHMATYENKMNGIKGVYRKDTGPAHSFRGMGKTWKEVLATLTMD